MAATVDVNERTVVHKTSEGVATAFPDVCLTPPAPVPVPYVNVAFSEQTADGSRTVTMDCHPIMLKGSHFRTSTGDEAGSAGGVMSGTNVGKAEFVSYSFDVLVEGVGVARQGDLMIQNELQAANTPPFPEVQPPSG